MNNNYPYMQDQYFLKEMDDLQIKEQYIKIVLLNNDEKPIEEIQGKVVSGSINIDGSSSMRRIANFTMITEDYNDLTKINSRISINKKINLVLGIRNDTEHYKAFDIIWYPLGTYVIISANTSKGTGGTNISLQLKDKMCLLNGECGGTLPASVTFHEMDTIDENGQYIIENPTIYQIIQELVHHFGGEQLGKIFINDVDARIKAVEKWIGSSPLYLLQRSAGQFEFTTNETEAANVPNHTMYSYGDDVGYFNTDFTYPGELIGDGGASVCTVLDSIVSTLGNYEYYYDVYGNFIFQEKKNFLNTTQAKVELDKMKNEDYIVKMDSGKSVYTFEGSKLVTSYSNAFQYGQVKNDFLVWGVRKNSDDQTFPIRFHLAIDTKPVIGNSYEVFFYKDPEDELTKAKVPRKYPSKDDFPPKGDITSFYYSKADDCIYKWDTKNKVYTQLPAKLETVVTKDWRTELYLQGAVAEANGTDTGYYYSELVTEWPKLYDVKEGHFRETVLKHPTDLDFYLDFVDASSAIGELSVSNIGRRTTVTNDDKINCMFEPEIPDLVIIQAGQDDTTDLRNECIASGQNYVQVDEGIYGLLATGGSFNSAFNLIKNMLQQYATYNSSISVSVLPIYYLEPNTRITVRDAESSIFGDYMINSISLPLDINSTMSLSCSKVIENY